MNNQQLLNRWDKWIFPCSPMSCAIFRTDLRATHAALWGQPGFPAGTVLVTTVNDTLLHFLKSLRQLLVF